MFLHDPGCPFMIYIEHIIPKQSVVNTENYWTLHRPWWKFRRERHLSNGCLFSRLSIFLKLYFESWRLTLLRYFVNFSQIINDDWESVVFILAILSPILIHQSCWLNAVNSGIFARVLFSRNLIEVSWKWNPREITLSITDIGKSCHCLDLYVF